MELILLVGLAAIATPIFSLLAYIKVQSLERQVATLMKKVAELSASSTVSATSSSAISTAVTSTEPTIDSAVDKAKREIETNEQVPPSAVSQSSNMVVEHSVETEQIVICEPVEEKLQSLLQPQPQSQSQSQDLQQAHSQQSNPNEKETTQYPQRTSDWVTQLLERWMAHAKENWLVWVGGIAMVVGVAYLIETVGSNFTLPLFARVLIAVVLSSSMIGVGEWLHRKISALDGEFLHQKADAYIPAAVYCAGMSGLYGTVLFSAVIHAFIPPDIALALMAMLAVVSLALTQRLGPLMAVLGLFGGYTAPVWIGGIEPNLMLLSCYITSISIAGIWVQQLTRIPWLTYGIIALHSLWLFAIAESLAQAQLLLWFALFIPLSTYLLVFVPQMGWTLRFQCHCRTRAPFFYAVIPAIVLGILLLLLLQKTPDVGWPSLIYFLFPMLLLILPVLRIGRAPRVLGWVNIIAILSIAIITIWLMHAQTGIKLGTLGLSAVLILSVLFRTIGQYWQGDKSQLAYWQAIILGPLLMVGSLLYIDFAQDEYRFVTTLFIVACMCLLGWLASKIDTLSDNLSAAMHALLLTISVVYSEGGVLTLLIAAQMLLVAVQYKRYWLTPNLFALKALAALLVVRLSLLPFWPEWQALVTPQWSWLLCTILPSLMVFTLVRHLLLKRDHPLAEWFDAAMLHLSVILVFAQTNYLLLGSYNFLYPLEFENVALFAGQSLALVGVYQFKAYTSQSMSQFYRGYSWCLMAAAALCIVVLNTIFQPLANHYVLGSDWPILNWLAIGWLIPALILVVIARFQLYPYQTRWLLGSASVLAALWAIYSIRQFWQDGPLTLNMPTSMAELFSYSVALILVGVAITYYGLQHGLRTVQTIGFVTLGIAVCKVFLWDAAALEGLWRAISFMGLGACLITLGWLFQRLQVRPIESE